MSRSLDQQIVEARPKKADVDPFRPYAFHLEKERGPGGDLDPVATLFLTNRECPFRCTMCDLWKNTTDQTVPLGAVPAQIDYALSRLPQAKQIKLYNSANFFDPRSIPFEDHSAIAEKVGKFETVIVENHPRFCRDVVFEFRDRLEGQLEVALGLETVHPEALARLNKQMTVDDYRRAAERLTAGGVEVRTFVLLKPPGLDEQEGIQWAISSVQVAIEAGSRCVAVIPARAGNGYMELLHKKGEFSPPKISSLESVLESCLPSESARVFADLWDLEKFSHCEICFQQRQERLSLINTTGVIPPAVQCECEVEK